MGKRSFATSISCIDGRIQDPISVWIKKNYHVDFVDTITEPGVDKVISRTEKHEQIAKKVYISISAHGSRLIVVSGHHDCAGNPISEEEHIIQIQRCVKILKLWKGIIDDSNIQIVGVWVDENWQIRRIV